MGRTTLNRQTNSFAKRRNDEASFFRHVHRARITDVHVDKGTINVQFERLDFGREITIPFMGLSIPPQTSETDKNYLRASWGRYIPQVGDIVLVAFGPDGAPYALGYHTISYESFDFFDLVNDSRGGIGWGDSSGRTMLKPGDWDWRSARGSALYLGDRASLSAGPHGISINKPTADITTATTLAIGKFGTGTETRQGGARRRVLPTDTNETDIYNSTGAVAQEVNYSVKIGPIPGGTEIARESFGDVIDETTFQPMLGESGQFVRRFTLLKDISGLLDVFTQKIDTGGNSVTEAQTAIKFSWNTPVAAWDVKNLSTKIESTSTIDIKATGVMTLEATGAATLKSSASVTLEAPSISLGQAASEPVLKGQTLMNAMSTLLGQMSGDWTALAGVLGIGTNSVAAITVFLAQLANYMSVKVKTE